MNRPSINWRQALALCNAALLGLLAIMIPSIASAIVGDEKAYWDFYDKTSFKPDMLAYGIYLALSAVYLKWEGRQLFKRYNWLPAAAFLIVFLGVMMSWV